MKIENFLTMVLHNTLYWRCLEQRVYNSRPPLNTMVRYLIYRVWYIINRTHAKRARQHVGAGDKTKIIDSKAIVLTI